MVYISETLQNVLLRIKEKQGLPLHWPRGVEMD